jgi:WD40 repeat protein
VGVVPRGQTDAAPTLAREIVYPASAFSPDGQRLATSGLALWRTTDWTRAWTTASDPPAPTDATVHDNSVAFSPDGGMILSSEADLTYQLDTMSSLAATKLYRASDGTLLRDLGGDLMRRPTFSPDGGWILAADQVWEIATGRSVSLHPDPRATSVSVFLSDGRIAVGRMDGVIEMFCPR